MYRIHEIAKMSGVSMEMIRKYERMGLIRQSRRSKSNYREYSIVDLRRVLMIRAYRKLCMPLETIHALTRTENADERRIILRAQVRELEERLHQTRRMLEETQRMETAVSRSIDQSITMRSALRPVFYGIYLGDQYQVEEKTDAFANWLSFMPIANFSLVMENPDADHLKRYLLISRDDAEKLRIKTDERTLVFPEEACVSFIAEFAYQTTHALSYDVQIRNLVRSFAPAGYEFKKPVFLKSIALCSDGNADYFEVWLPV